jgi:hypothetical protein
MLRCYQEEGWVRERKNKRSHSQWVSQDLAVPVFIVVCWCGNKGGGWVETITMNEDWLRFAQPSAPAGSLSATGIRVDYNEYIIAQVIPLRLRESYADKGCAMP